jgi:hypothetical protein
MSNLLNKIQILQFILIFSFYILSNITKDEEILDKTCPYYNFLLNITKYSKALKNNDNQENNNQENNNKENNNQKNNNKENDTKNDNLKIITTNTEYFYYFNNNNNVYAFFFKEKNSINHDIYFNGIHSIDDIKTIIKIIFNNFTYENIEDILNKKGNLYNVEENKISQINNESEKVSVIDVFDSFYKNLYSLDDNTNKIRINGYSLGGPISQVFIHIIKNKYEKSNNQIKLNIELFNIESWFASDKKNYEMFIQDIKFVNLFNKRSVLYFYNKLFQKYNKIDYFIENNKLTKDNLFIYVNKIFPNGIIKYIKNYHLLQHIVK